MSSVAVRPYKQVEGSGITLSLSGPAVADTYPLQGVAAILVSFNRILANTAEIITEYETEDHIEYRVVAGFPKKGSYLLDVNIVQAGVALATIAGSSDLVPKVLETIKSAFELFKSVLGNKEKPEVSEPDNNGNMVVNTGSGKVIVNQYVINTVARNADEFAEVLRNLQQSEIENLKLADQRSEAMSLNSQDARLIERRGAKKQLRSLQNLGASFSSPRGVLSTSRQFNQPVEVLCEVMSFDKSRMGGRLRVIDSSALPAGIYDFRLMDASAERAILGMLRESIRVSALAETKRGRILLNIIGIEASKGIGA